jgi:hypothetical protein
LGGDGRGFIGRRAKKNLFEKDGTPKSAGKIAFSTDFCHACTYEKNWLREKDRLEDFARARRSRIRTFT